MDAEQPILQEWRPLKATLDARAPQETAQVRESFITADAGGHWRGRPLRPYRRRYPIGKRVSAAELKGSNIEPDDFHGDWNYVIRPEFRLLARTRR